MTVYLVRHGKAEDGPVDTQRRLADRGRKAVRKLAERLESAGVHVDRIEHSGLVRARETAEILQESLGGEILEVSGLRPEDDVEPVANRLDDMAEDDVMLVGHNPFMEELASYLLVDDADTGLLHFRTGAVACLSHDGSGWVLEWFLHPQIA